MIPDIVWRWFTGGPHPHDQEILRCYQVTFSTPEGKVVLQHLIGQVYCQIYGGKDPIELAQANGRRSVVQEIMENATHRG